MPDSPQRRSYRSPTEEGIGRSSDEALLDGLRAGDRAVFDAIYETYRPRLYSFLLRLTQDEQLARDLSQETWMRLAANAARLAPSTVFGAWLFTVARNLFVSHRRWSIVYRNNLPLLTAFFADPSVPTPLEQISTADLDRRLERALAELPPRYREVVLLVTVEGFSAAEVAGMLRLEPATVRKRLERGRAQLKRKLEDLFEHGEAK